MLPSTGYFKTINCPFYDNGLCERPYCHFKHPRRDDGTSNIGVPTQSVATNEEERVDGGPSDSNTFQQLVSQAVKKVLADHKVAETGKISQKIVSRVVEELNPTLNSAAGSVSHQEILITKPTVQATPCVYNPTPIAELKKRHIPVVPYMPTRESKVAIKRKSSPDRFKPWLSIPQEIANSLDNTASVAPSYSSVKVTEITYKPTAISSSGDASFVRSYVPTVKSDSSSSNSYEDGNSNDYIFKNKDEYRPRSKKRREEYVPKKLKAPLKTVQQLEEPGIGELLMSIDESLNAGKEASARLEIQDSQDYDPEIEAQFSEEEEPDQMINSVVKGDNKAEGEVRSEDKPKTSHKSSNRSEDKRNGSKSKEASNSSKAQERRDSSLSKERGKSKDKSEKDKEGRKVQKKDSEEASTEDTSRDREKRKHSSSSSSKERHHSSSSSRDKNKRQSSRERKESRHSTRESSKKRENSSRSSKDKDKNEEHTKSSSHQKHKSKSNSSSSRDRYSSKKTDKSRSRSSTKSSSSSKKTEARKKSDDEVSSAEDHDEKENSPSIRFRGSPSYLEEILEISDSDHDIEEECLKIFQEYEVTEHPKEVRVKEHPRREPEEAEEPGRKRVAHASAGQYTEYKRTPIQPVKAPPNPHLKLTDRWRLMREAIAEKVAAAAALQSSASLTSSQTSDATPSAFQSSHKPTTNMATKGDQIVNGNGRLRIAHVPYATSLALAKKKVSEAMNKNSESKTVAQTAKGGSRVAHVPQIIPQLIRPEPLHVATQKFPLNVRQYYVNMMQDICIQIYTNGEDAAQRALREEFACHERCKAVAVYKNSCMLATHRLRKELDQQSSAESGSSPASGTVSHEAVLAGKSKGSWSVVKTKRSVMEFKGATLYALLSKWIMTEEQLKDNGFPRPHPDGPTGRVKIYVTNTRNQSILSKVPNERFCSRCNQPYMVDKHGNAVLQQNCIYHWGRKFTIRGEGRYSCCQQYGSATGCCDAKTHVWEYVDYKNLRGYVKTLPKDYIPVEEQGVYALDCEMSYTTQGLELTRVTVINEECNVVYETLVKPVHPVIDYNTRFSGITEQHMEGVTTSLLDVQATLLTMFSDKTILIGHSLESDFKALKLVHDTVVDTSVMFPHRNGYPQKRALRNLCSEYLQKIIQNDVGGHDSNEDAVSCMELVLWKLKEEAKSQ
ncbi:RNA exonuclease 1 homolog [Neodiprion fabricii]|uniref:RNA exonuclease 1 homolog n=1 Tax=Neodiprion fabricii TaxID=2872261 RepID=UPI001ED96BD9|nr:RNA exonuclease 1 homolog [Neodiprion fabricii]